MENKSIIGCLEKVRINDHEVLALIDTGATRSSIDLDLASDLKLGPIIKKSIIRSSHGKSVRPVVKAKIEIAGRKINAFFNISARSHMSYKVLIGRNILKKGFLVDPSKGDIK